MRNIPYVLLEITVGAAVISAVVAFLVAFGFLMDAAARFLPWWTGYALLGAAASREIGVLILRKIYKHA